jgi:hypothetical protein
MFSVFQLCMEPTLKLWALIVLVIHVEGMDYVIDTELCDQVSTWQGLGFASVLDAHIISQLQPCNGYWVSFSRSFLG